MADAYNSTAVLTNLVKTAYDRKMRLALRSVPQFRAIADTRPAAQTNPGDSVAFHIYSDLAAATTPLNEVTEPDAVAIANPTPISVTLQERGNYAVVTKRLQEFSLDGSLNGNIANILAFNMVDSLDKVIEAVLAGGSQVVRESAGSLSTSAAITTITGTDVVKSRDFRYAITKLRAANVVPTRGDAYACYIHPEVSLDLRTETGAASWRVPQEYEALDGLLAEEKLQKIELAGIEIKDPYNSFITVAFLPTIFVEFSLAGLARQEIEKIDLIGPSLHVGQGLFWWIDYQRNFREQNEGASLGIDAGVEAARKPDWVIRTINATAGKIVIAPIGIPIGIVPFPFDATTSMSGGNIELKLTIPDEDHVYRFPDYKVDLYGLTGDVQFNVPVEEIDNNLVQTFALKRAVWKEHEARDLYITVTFDSDGVYGQFGGASYDGYAEGQFNFYLNDPGKWDAWIAGTEMNTGPLTKVLVPDTFLMEGRVSLKVIAGGRDKVVGETTGEFQATGPGWFDITKLDAVLEKLPPGWNNLKRGLAELSLNSLKRFDYDKGAGSLYFQDRAGELNLRFAGDYGSRELNFYLHDQRSTKEKSAASLKVSAPPAPRAEATAATAAPADSQ